MKNIIKKFYVVVMLFMVTISFSACNTKNVKVFEESKDVKVFEVSKQAYANLNQSYEIIERYSSDIYNAWYEGIYNSKKCNVSYLATKTSLTASELYLGVSYFCIVCDGKVWETSSEEERKKYQSDTYFSIMKYAYDDSIFNACVNLISCAYKANGIENEIDTKLASARTNLKEVSNINPNYENYATLKQLYTKVNSFYNFCSSPTGSFEQLVSTTNNYKNECRDLFDELKFTFD